MRLFTLLTCTLLFSCSTSTYNSLDSGAAGNWLVLYADHSRLTAEQIEKYQPLQDSIVDLYGLKLLQLMPGGVFQEMDSLLVAPGRWNIFQHNTLLVADAGKGFEVFVGEFLSLQKGKLKLLQKVIIDTDSLPITWAWKKIEEDDQAAALFEADHNEWREKSDAPESDAALKSRLVAMLDYYAVYFNCISKEAMYFLPRRLPLPFNYYAHSVRLKHPGNIARFQQYFYSEADALKAYKLLQNAQDNLSAKFPQEDNFVKEYAAYFIQLKNALEETN